MNVHARTSILFRIAFVLILVFVTLPSQAGAQNPGDDDDQIPGLISETRWQSPQFNYRVSWTSDWEVVPEADYTWSDEEGLTDVVSIRREDILLAVTFVQSVDETAEHYTGRVIELREELEDVADFEVYEEGVEDDVAYLWYTGTEGDKALSTLVEVRVIDPDNGILVMVALTTWEDDEALGLEWVLEDVEVDRDLPFWIYTVDAADS